MSVVTVLERRSIPKINQFSTFVLSCFFFTLPKRCVYVFSATMIVHLVLGREFDRLRCPQKSYNVYSGTCSRRRNFVSGGHKTDRLKVFIDTSTPAETKVQGFRMSPLDDRDFGHRFFALLH